MEKIKLKAIINGKAAVFEVERGTTALDALDENGVAVYAPCGGAGHCGGCRAIIKGNIRTTADENRVLGEASVEKNVHLLCSTELLGDVEIEINTNISEESDTVLLSPDAGCEYGVAIDIGTTTVAVYICSLDDGKIVFEDAFPNPQSRFGADVITRIGAIKKDADALKKQKDILFERINESIGRFSSDRNIFARAVVCGNTVMEHIAAGLDPSGIAEYPFECLSLFGYEISAEKIGLEVRKGAGVYFAPCVSSYVGGDITCGAVAAALDKATGDTLYIDVGTNGEIAIKHGEKIYFCSAAAGPALEGAGISQGMPSVDGAVYSVSSENNILLYKTIKNKAAQGICGSGVIDAAATLIEIEAIDETGKMTDCAIVERVGGKKAVKIADGVFFTEDDVRAVQLAKAAIAAGIKVLAKRSGTSLNSIEKMIIAGGFGANIGVGNAVKIGLFPKETASRAVSAGNAAGKGAVAMLTDESVKARAERIAREGEYVELSTDGKFVETFVEEIGFEI